MPERVQILMGSDDDINPSERGRQLGIPEFEVVKEYRDVLKYLKVGIIPGSDTPYWVFGRNDQAVDMYKSDRIGLYVETPGDNNGDPVGNLRLDMTEQRIVGLWRTVNQKNRETSHQYKKLKKQKSE